MCCGDAGADMGEPGSISGRGDDDLAGEVIGGGWFPGTLDAAVGGADLQDFGGQVFGGEEEVTCG